MTSFTQHCIAQKRISPSENNGDRPRQRRAPNGQNTRGQRVHQCQAIIGDGTECGKLFTRREHLRRHQVVKHSHTSETPQLSTRETSAGPISLRHPSIVQPVTYHFGQRNAAEAELVSYYVRYADTIFVDEQSVVFLNRYFWLDMIPQTVHHGGKLLDMALCVSCAHLSMLHRDKETYYSDLSVRYFIRALATQRQDIAMAQKADPSLPKDIVDSILFIASLIPLITYWCIERDSLRASCTDEQLFDDILQWQRSNQETIKAVNHFRNPSTNQPSAFEHTTFRKCEDNAREAMNAVYPPDGICSSINFLDDIIIAARLDGTSEEIIAPCNMLVRNAEWLYQALLIPNMPRAAFLFQTITSMGAPPGFAELLRVKHPLAIAVWARLLAVEAVPGLPWWCRVGNLERKMLCFKSFMPERWEWMMDMPLGLARGKIRIVDVVEKRVQSRDMDGGGVGYLSTSPTSLVVRTRERMISWRKAIIGT